MLLLEFLISLLVSSTVQQGKHEVSYEFFHTALDSDILALPSTPFEVVTALTG
jgi:hypothetical protein